MKFYINGVELKRFRVTAGPLALNHLGLRRNVSMGGGFQQAYDIAPWAEGQYDPERAYSITCSEDVEVVERNAGAGNYIVVKSRRDRKPAFALLVHTYFHAKWKPGKKIKAGTEICRIAPTSENGGHPAHLHIDMTNKAGLQTRKLIWMPQIRLGNAVVRRKTNFRRRAGINNIPYSYDFCPLQDGVIGTVYGESFYADGLFWQPFRVYGKQGWVTNKYLKATSRPASEA